MGIRPARRKPINARTRQRVLEFWKHRCARCGTGRELELHHKLAVVHGGGNQLANLVVLCKSCHFNHEHDFSEHIWPDLEAVFLKTESASTS
ncbi:MAG: HNH endonuclease [Terriglobia bacterium]